MDECGHATLDDLEQYLHGQLDVRRRARLQLHLEQCAACQEQWRRCRQREDLARELRAASAADNDTAAET